MQNGLILKNVYLEGFQVILNYFPLNLMFYNTLNLLICISKIDFRKTLFVVGVRFSRTGGGGGVRRLRTCPQLLVVFYTLSLRTPWC